MELKKFPYGTTSVFKKYSKLITCAICQFNAGSPIGTIVYDPSSEVGKKNEDLLKYWDGWSNDITFGRYLVFENCKNEKIEFWLGLSSTYTKARFIIWFKKDQVSNYITALENAYPPARCEESRCEVWITLDDNDFLKFCDKTTKDQGRKDIIKDFLVSVLGLLK
jgi:hypothetical protein